MKNLNKFLALLIIIVLANFSDGYAQNDSISFTIKSTGQTRIFSNGKLKMNTNSGRIRTENTSTNLDNLGTIELNGSNNIFTAVTNDDCDDFSADSVSLAYGSSASARIPGLVSYSGATSQDVQSRFYTDLAMDGAGSKNVPDSVFVSGDYTAPGTGGRNYTGTFTYDGSNDQTILGEPGGSGASYEDVVFQNAGVKTLLGGTTASIQNLTIESSSGNVIINGDMNLAETITQSSGNTMTIDSGSVSIGTGASSLAGTVNISGGSGNEGSLTLDDVSGSLAIDGDLSVDPFGSFNIVNGDATIGSGGSLALANSPDAKIDLSNGTSLTVTGTLSNANAAGDNVTFADLSTVTYNGAGGQTVMATTETNPYGNLSITSPGEKVASGLVALSNNFSLDSANFNLGDCSTGGSLFMTDGTASANYADTITGYEVIGKFKRNILGQTNALTFNNYATTVQLDNGAALNFVELCVVPNDTTMIDFLTATDVRRTIKYSYDSVGGAGDWATSIKYGYKTSELDNANQTNAFKNTLRFREELLSEAEKVSTGQQPIRDTTVNAFNSVLLASIRGTDGRRGTQTALAEVTSDNRLFLRGGPATFISIADGRWSNPATWDEGEQPGATDIVKIRTNVHIGFTRDGIDGLTAAGQINENDKIAEKGGGVYTNRNTIAARIEINDGFGGSNNSNTATLIVGGDGSNNLSEMVGITKLADNDPLASIVGQNGTVIIKQGSNLFTEAEFTTFEAASPDPDGVEESSTQYNNGLVIRPGAELLARNNICVEGAFNLGGEVNVGEED